MTRERQQYRASDYNCTFVDLASQLPFQPSVDDKA
jgi:hypothetical protein